MENEIKSYLLLLLVFVLLVSCKKAVEAEVPKDRVVTSRVFQSDSKAISALTAIYGNMINGSPSFTNCFSTIYPGLSSDDMQPFSQSASNLEILENNISDNNPAVYILWKSAYQSIYFANSILEGLNTADNLSSEVKTLLEAEAKFIRGFCYFYLGNYFGAVPLLLETDFRSNAVAGRTPIEKVWEQVDRDLSESKQGLGETYPGNERNRPNRYAASALLARFYLYQKNWQKAEAEASAVLSSGIYLPLASLSDAFLKNSRESIWQLSPRNGFLTETTLTVPLGEPPSYYLRPELVQRFEPGDLRRQKWVDSMTYQNVKYYYPAKYRNMTSAVKEYYTVLRVPEVLLIRSEARMHLGNREGAIEDLNIIRKRAGLPPLLTNLAEPQVQTAIEQERRSEYFAEWGHRWFDVIRWGKANEILGAIKSSWRPTAVLFPIPASEIVANPSLTQNPGY